ncbi:16S rRNA (guanine(527)-N(7))-methyltransferase RsmG [Sphingomonas sp. RB3P16]|uniref:16S rRNA (guanine(527)-N(7))-methyltransferase RsmG n=1 Tax=Parasphingomonas frigoris TaxID=3096163 RepID=UPI002FC639A8
MSEDDAKAWILAHFGATAATAMKQLVAIVVAEAAQQNLVSPSTLGAMWSRHVVDSAQLLDHATNSTGPWIDIGSGAGFPGLVIAALTDRPIWLVEPRKRRAAFLQDAAQALGVAQRTTVVCGRIEAVSVPAAIISARAVGSLDDLFSWASRCATRETQWILPKGRSAREEVVTAEQAWHGLFHVEHSITDPESLIVVASGVARR